MGVIPRALGDIVRFTIFLKGKNMKTYEDSKSSYMFLFGMEIVMFMLSFC